MGATVNPAVSYTSATSVGYGIIETTHSKADTSISTGSFWVLATRCPVIAATAA
jgi:hypothetical protein